jgi:hypothetical protein
MPSLKILLKVLTNENRGGLNLASFDRSPFKLFSLRFSNKSVQAPSCERPKTAQRTLSLLFANKNCIPISASCRAPTNFPHHTLICNNGIVHPPWYLRWRQRSAHLKLNSNNKKFTPFSLPDQCKAHAQLNCRDKL